VGSTPCLSIPALLITPPDDTRSVRVVPDENGSPFLIQACMALSVTPVRAGTNPD
jgi:hypothetical protein